MTRFKVFAKHTRLVRASLMLATLSLTSAVSANNTAFGPEPDADSLWATGTAWAPDKSRVLYQEFHFAENPELDLPTRVQYRTPDGELFAEKVMDYTPVMTAPRIRQIDYRNSARIETQPLTDMRPPRVEIGFQAHDSNQFVQAQVPLREDLVVDAGFDPFIRANWDRLTTGRAVSAHFLVPARQDTVRVNLSSTDQRNCSAVQAPLSCFVIRPAGLLRVVGFLVDPIYIGYEQDSRRLAMFSGISNLRDDRGEPQNVLITYEYH